MPIMRNFKMDLTKILLANYFQITNIGRRFGRNTNHHNWHISNNPTLEQTPFILQKINEVINPMNSITHLNRYQSIR